MEAEIYYIDAWCFGLGWICFGYVPPGTAEYMEAAARDADDQVWPGKAPRPTRIRRKSAAGLVVVSDRQAARMRKQT